MSNISNLIYKFSDNWSSFKEDSRKKSENKSLFVIDKNKPQYRLFNYEIPNEIKKIVDDNRFIIDSSLGQTNISAIPWIAILNKEITTTVQKGFYIVYLFSRNAKKIYLSIGLGAQQFVDVFGSNNKCTARIAAASKRIMGYCDYLNKDYQSCEIKLSDLEDKLFSEKFGPLTLPSKYKINNYEAGCLFSKEYDLSKSDLTDELFLNDLKKHLNLYTQMEEDSIIKNLILNITDSVFNKKDDSPEKFNLDYKLKSFIPNPEIKNPKKKSGSSSINKRHYKRNSLPSKIVGEAGEKYVYEYEYNKLKKCGKVDLAEKIVKQCDDKSFYPGYDIQSFDEDGEKIYIEVKSTKGSKRNNFEISENEIRAAEDYGSQYFIYHVVNALKNPTIDIFIKDPSGCIARNEILKEPISYNIKF